MVDVESDDPVEQSELEELMNKVLGIVKNIEEKLNGKKEENKDNDKDRINKAFEKKQIGRPVRSWEDKRKQYFEWITSIKSLNQKMRLWHTTKSTKILQTTPMC